MNNDPAKAIIDHRLFVKPPTNTFHSNNYNFSKAMELLERGKCLTREIWDGKRIIYRGYIIFQIDNEIKRKKYVISSTLDGKCEDWIPENDDLFANDWAVVSVGEDTQSCDEPIITPRPRIKQK